MLGANYLFWVTLVCAFAVLPWASPVSAQEIADQDLLSQPLSVEQQVSENAYRLSNGEVIHFQDDSQVGAANLSQSGGPDQFGYTWEEVAIDWIDATAGTDAGFSGKSSGQAIGPIKLPFAFPYYENSHTELYIAAAGYLSFENQAWWRNTFTAPLPSTPNNVIAPYASPLEFDGSDSGNRVYFVSGGEAPNRHFVVEWHQVRAQEYATHTADHTFQVVLYETGNIRLQYLSMEFGDTGRRWCGVANIENSNGKDGFYTTRNCGWIEGNTAIKIVRPAVSARTLVYPLSMGSFTTAGAVTKYSFSVQNTGALGTDTFDFEINSLWDVQLERADGTILYDTNSNSTIDTGPLKAGESQDYIAVTHAPSIANTADSNQAQITAVSQLDSTIKRPFSINTAIPAPFAQLYTGGSNRSLHVSSSQPSGQSVTKVSDTAFARELAISRLLENQYISVWSKWRTSNDESTMAKVDLAYAIHNQSDSAAAVPTWLTADGHPEYEVGNLNPVIATTADGYIGIIWLNQLADADYQNTQTNIFFAILDRNGNMVLGPTNLTQNTMFGNWLTPNLPGYYEPTLIATDDSRFLLFWGKSISPTQGVYENGIEYQIFESTGIAQTDISPLMSMDTLGYNRHPSLIQMVDGQLLLSYLNIDSGISYAILNSDGTLARAATVLDENGGDVASTQLPNGNLLLAWTHSDYENDITKIRYRLVDGETFLPMGSTTVVEPFVGTQHLANVSITHNAAGQGVLTWGEQNGTYLGYLLLDGAGTQLTPPTQFASAEIGPEGFSQVRVGFGSQNHEHNAPFAFTPTTRNQADLSIETSTVAGGQPGGTATIEVDVKNSGLQTANETQLVATLDPTLELIDAVPPPDNVQAATLQMGGTYTWTLPSIDYLGGGSVVLRTTVPSTTIGSTYPVTFQISSSSGDVDAENNAITTRVMEALQIFLALIYKE